MKVFSQKALLVFVLLCLPLAAHAQEIDTDNDGLHDGYETFFGTDPFTADTDNDGYSDYLEIINGYDPLISGGKRLKLKDTDGDELWDWEEVRYKTDPQNTDTDGDGYKDKLELINGYNPNGHGILDKWIEIDISSQTLRYGQGPKVFNTFPISSGTAGFPTPKGEFKVNNKIPLAWSSYGLWMPYWMPFVGNTYGIHELPYWPNGYREGEATLGKPASHGCVRLGIGAAEEVYKWADIGTKMIIKD